MVTDGAVSVAAEKEKTDEKGKGGKGDAKKGKDKGDNKKVSKCTTHDNFMPTFFRVVLIYKKVPVAKK